MRFPRALGLTLFVSSFYSAVAFAGPAFYVDGGGGYVQMRDASQFYNGSVGNGTGYGMNLGIWTTFTNGDPALEFQLGVEDRYETVSSSGLTYGLNIPYPVIRLQASRIFLSGGYTPYVMSSIGGSSAQHETMQHTQGAKALIAEMGTLLPVTPRFSFGFSGSYESVTVNGVKSPSPILSGNFFMRFYFGFGDGSRGRSSNEFRGWRYPFGKELF